MCLKINTQGFSAKELIASSFCSTWNTSLLYLKRHHIHFHLVDSTNEKSLCKDNMLLSQNMHYKVGMITFGRHYIVSSIRQCVALHSW